MCSLKVINDRSTLCTPLTHQSMITRLAVMTWVCFLPSSLFLPHHCNQHPFAPSCIFVSFIWAHIIVTVSKSSYQLRWGETTFASVRSLSFRLSLQKILPLSNFSTRLHRLSVWQLFFIPLLPLPKSSHVRRVIGQMCHTTVDEQ